MSIKKGIIYGGSRAGKSEPCGTFRCVKCKAFTSGFDECWLTVRKWSWKKFKFIEAIQSKMCRKCYNKLKPKS